MLLFQPLFQPFPLSASASLMMFVPRGGLVDTVVNWRTGAVINVSAGELRATEGREVSRSLVVSGLSMHTTGVTSP